MIGIILNENEYSMTTKENIFFYIISIFSRCADYLEEKFSSVISSEEFGSKIECFVTVSDDYGYGFTLYDQYGTGERRLR